MSAWGYLWRLVRYKLLLFSAVIVLSTVAAVFYMLPGLILREFFNALTGGSSGPLRRVDPGGTPRGRQDGRSCDQFGPNPPKDGLGDSP